MRSFALLLTLLLLCGCDDTLDLVEVFLPDCEDAEATNRSVRVLNRSDAPIIVTYDREEVDGCDTEIQTYSVLIVAGGQQRLAIDSESLHGELRINRNEIERVYDVSFSILQWEVAEVEVWAGHFTALDAPTATG